MKKLSLGIAAVLFSLTMQAQNTNLTETTKTTVRTVKDSDGEKKMVKQQTTQEAQDIKFKDTKGDPLNKEIEMTPSSVVSMTTITNPDGTMRTVDIDRSAKYTSSTGKTYTVNLDAMGYRVTSDDMKKPALMRKTSNNSYIYRTKDGTSIGYFDTDGNIILESYDDKSDKVTMEKFMKAN